MAGIEEPSFAPVLGQDESHENDSCYLQVTLSASISAHLFHTGTLRSC